MLFKMNKLHPQVLDDEMLAFELECLKEYVSKMQIGPRDEQNDKAIADKPVSNSVGPVVKDVTPKAKRTPRKAKAPVQEEPVAVKPVFTFDTAQFKGVLPTTNTTPHTVTVETTTPIIPKTKQAPASTDVTSCQCMARVVSSSKGAMSYDYMSYPNGSTTHVPLTLNSNPISTLVESRDREFCVTPVQTVYGRRCKNVKIDNSQFCLVHSKKCEYGVFTEEASEAVKAVCLKKYTRCKEIEDNQQTVSA